MVNNRIKKHPILTTEEKEQVHFFWINESLSGINGEPISSSLIANGIHVFGHHPKDQSPQGIFCANGQCSQCMVISDGLPVKACITPLRSGMKIEPANQLISLPPRNKIGKFNYINEIDIPVLIIGGGPAGLSAGLELVKAGIKVIIIDDKQQLGGKLVLQTHRFFGSTKTVFAGTRGIEIAKKLSNEIAHNSSIEIWTNSTAIAVYSDKKVGILKNGVEYVLVKPDHLLIACGAREKFLSFKGNTLPGVFGAGAFQTLINRDLVLPGKRIFIVGGGNVGLIAGYHALQAGIEVAGLIEVMPECGGYKVHKDKLKRLGVPIFTSHTILSANGKELVESVTIAQVNKKFQIIKGTERSISCDCVLIAVGLDPVNEFFLKAIEFEMSVFVAGDADEIAEASAAIISGKVKGLEIANKINVGNVPIPQSWYDQKTILASKPGKTIIETQQGNKQGVFPVFHCIQEIPCDPCVYLCPLGLIEIDGLDIRNLPVFQEVEKTCSGCANCVAGCPGLAITLVDYRKNKETPLISIPFEFNQGMINVGDLAAVQNTEGITLAKVPVIEIIGKKSFNATRLIKVSASKLIAEKIAGYKIQDSSQLQEAYAPANRADNQTIICRCERVTIREIRDLIRSGYKDINEIKTITRTGMGACGGKTCHSLILQIFKEENIPNNEITALSKRPLFIEVPLKTFAGSTDQDK